MIAGFRPQHKDSMVERRSLFNCVKRLDLSSQSASAFGNCVSTTLFSKVVVYDLDCSSNCRSR